MFKVLVLLIVFLSLISPVRSLEWLNTPDTPFVCEQDPFRYERAEIERLANNPFHKRLLQALLRRYEAETKIKACEAYAAGDRTVTFDCMNGQRDWIVIMELVPDKYHDPDMDKKELGSFATDQSGYATDLAGRITPACRKAGVYK